MLYRAIVGKNGTGNFETITEAVESIPADADAAVIWIKNGIYREKLFVRRKNLLLIGESRENTILTWQDGAYFPHPDGGKFGTFRSYTAYLGGGKIGVKNMTVRNTAGCDDIAGQSIAVYADAEFARFENVSFESRQDTLFLAPLPAAPRTPGSFVGPGDGFPRRACRDYLENCRIVGDVDFIFGGAEAAFSHCTIISLNRGKKVNGYITAASTPDSQKFGFLFERCELLSDCSANTVYLGRPWRKSAQVSFLDCRMGNHIKNDGWVLWTLDSGEEKTVRFSEYACTGEGASGKRPAWIRSLSYEEAAEILKEINSLSTLCDMGKTGIE